MTPGMQSDDILARLRQQDLEKPQHKDRHRIAFIALRDPIEQAVKGGATAKRIWTLLRDENKISCSYYTFSRYVNSLILGNHAEPPTLVKSSAKTVGNRANKPHAVTPKENTDTDSIKNFVYAPLILTKDDL